MKEIKAFVRRNRIADVIQALRESGLFEAGSNGSGCHNMTVSEVQRPFASADPAQQHYSMELAEPVIAEFKLELVCSDDLAEPLANVIAKAGHTGQPEAGWIFVSDVQSAVEIR